MRTDEVPVVSALGEAFGAAKLSAPSLAVPRGWISVRQRCEQRGVCFEAASKELLNSWHRGELERKLWPNPSGKGSPCYIYRRKRQGQ